jgi:hypothetical protein
MDHTFVYVIDAWDDDAEESYVRVFATLDKAKRDLARWQADTTSLRACCGGRSCDA